MNIRKYVLIKSHVCLNSALSYKAEITLLKKKKKKIDKFLDFQESYKSCGHSENIPEKKESLAEA